MQLYCNFIAFECDMNEGKSTQMSASNSFICLATIWQLKASAFFTSVATLVNYSKVIRGFTVYEGSVKSSV